MRLKRPIFLHLLITIMDQNIKSINMIQECKLHMTATTNNIRRSRVLHFLKLILCFQLISLSVFAQKKATVRTGEYDNGVSMAYDSVSGEISGFMHMDVPAQNNPKKVYRSCSVLF